MNLDSLFEWLEQCSDSEKRSVFASLHPQELLEKSLQAAREEGKALAGELCFVKDNVDVPGLSTQASSLFLEERRPGPHVAGSLVRRLDELGLTLVGKTQMNEFAYGLDGANPHYGDCPHPFLPGRCSGGSSSGSAWAVARELVPIAFGTDTGGSIRVPAAFCGLFGFRLPPDDWAKDGCFPLAPRFDSVGWFTRSLEEMSRFTSALLNLPLASPRELRIVSAVPEHPFLSAAVQKQFPEAVPVNDFVSETLSAERVCAYNILQSREALAVHEEWVDSCGGLYDPAVLKLILRGRNWTDQDVVNAGNVAQEMDQYFEQTFKDADVILYPVSLQAASVSPMSQRERTGLLTNTVPASLAGLPVLTLTVLSPEGPLGIQCMLPKKNWQQILSRLLTPA